MKRILMLLGMMVMFTTLTFGWGGHKKSTFDTTITGVVYVYGGSPSGSPVVSFMEIQLAKWNGTGWTYKGGVFTEQNGHFEIPAYLINCPIEPGTYRVKAIEQCCGYDGDFTYPGGKGAYSVEVDCTTDITGLTFVYDYKYY